MSGAIGNVGNRPVIPGVQGHADQASKIPAKIPAPAQAPAPKAAGAAKQASVVSIGQPTPNLALYSAKGTTATAAAKPEKPEKSASSGTGNSDGSYTAGDAAVKVTVENSDSYYQNKIYYSTDNFATKHLIGVDNQTGTVDIGKFKAGTKIDFGIDNGQGDFFRTGSASANSDNVVHAQASTAADGGHQIGFEDLRGGGDRDYNDAIVSVRSAPEQSAPVAADKPPKDNTNRSGLGDGTNPGQGAGRANSPNTGTLNPSNSGASDVNAALASKPDKAPKDKTPSTTTAHIADKPPASHVADKTPSKTVSGAADNRSGLGDGTNPGKGVGKANSPNTGTLNPSASSVSPPKAATTSEGTDSVQANERKAAAALQAYQTPQELKFTTIVRV